MIKVLLISAGHQEQNGGIERHCRSLCNLLKNSNSISLSILQNNEAFKIPIINKYYYKWSNIWKFIKSSGADIIHVHGYLHPCTFQVFLVAILQKKQIVFSPHFHPFEYINRPILGRLYFTAFIKPLLRFVSAIITLNDDDSHFFRKYNHVMIPHWIDTVVPQNDIKRKKNFILFVGRNDNNKGIEYLYQLPKKKYEVHCVTDGVLERTDFIQYFNISDEELNRLYFEASVLVVPSRYEAFSLVSLEALKRGCPILISDKVRIADYLRGVSGVEIFKYGDYLDFIEKLPVAMSKSVDIDKVNNIFSKENAKKTYLSTYINVFNKH